MMWHQASWRKAEHIMFDRIRIISSELVLGSVVVAMTILTALSGYDGAMADSKQNEYEVMAQKELTNATADYLTANQMIVYDYQLFDGAYTADSEEKAQYYIDSYSEQLSASITANPDDPFNDAYYESIYADAQALFDTADKNFGIAAQFDERGDALQLVMLTSALGLALVAWASLLSVESQIRVAFSLIGICLMVYTIYLYVMTPAAPQV
jgi:hypothetical protein